VLGAIVGIAFAALYQYSTTPTYQSRIEILIGQRSSELAISGTMSNAHASGDVIHEDQLATHMQLLMSRRIIGNAFKGSNLKEIASISKAISEGQNPVDFIIEHLEVVRGGEGSAENAMVLSATYIDPSPNDAAVILGALFESYQEYVESHSKNTSEEAAKLIDSARIENEIELVQADKEYRAFIQSVPALLEGERVRDIHKNRLDTLETELNEVRARFVEAKSRLSVIKTYLDKNGDEVVDDMDNLALLSQKETERLKLFLDVSRGGTQSEAFAAEQPVRAEAARTQYNRLLDLLQKQQTLIDLYGGNHPLIEVNRLEIKVIQDFIAANAPAEAASTVKKLDGKGMLSTFTRLLQNDVAEFEIREKLLVEKSSLELIAAKEVENSFLEGNAKKAKLLRAQARYDEVIRRLQELNLAGSYAGFSTDLLASPEPPSSPNWPKLPIVAVIGLLAGLFLGAAVGLTAELLDSTFQDVDDLEATLGAAAVAHVPRFDFRNLKIPGPDKTVLSRSLVVAHCPRSSEAEVYRVARTSLLIKLTGNAHIVLMMTSPHPGDGKSTTISNLAISFAQTGRRVLLIDSDLRRPVIASLFGVEGKLGLADVLQRKCELSKAVSKTEVSNLFVMTHGTDTSVPAELLQSNLMRQVIQAARKSFDVVLIDAPPLLAVADPAIVAPMVDGVVITVRVCKNGRRPVERSIKILREIGVTPIAVVVNGVDRKRVASYGYGHQRPEEYGYVAQYHRKYAAKEPPSVDVEHAQPHRNEVIL